jgi:GBP family porin
MFKPCIILAALCGLANTASAQSSVTLYGLVDLSLQNVRSGNQSALAGSSLTRLADGTVYGPGSRWGMRVVEDLGGGLRTTVVLESGFLADTGASGQGGRLFGRQSYVALSSASAGEIRLGRQYSMHDETMGATNPTGNATALNPGGAFTLKSGTFSPFIDAVRQDNALQYLTPIMNGFRVQAMVAASEKTQDRYMGLKGSYTGDPLNVAVSYDQSKANTVVPGGKSAVNKIFEAGANYDFGAFKLYAGYQQGKDLTTGIGTQFGTLALPGLPGPATEMRAYNLGASAMIGATTYLMANFTRSRFTSASGADVTTGRTGVGAIYSLSKQTSLYGAIAFATGDLKKDVNEKQVYQIGLRKTF